MGIQVHSETEGPDRGTKFSFTIALKRAPTPPKDNSEYEEVNYAGAQSMDKLRAALRSSKELCSKELLCALLANPLL